MKDPFHLCSLAMMTKNHEACKNFNGSQETEESTKSFGNHHMPMRGKKRAAILEREGALLVIKLICSTYGD